MLIRGATEHDILRAADEAGGIRVSRMRRNGRGWRLVLRTDGYPIRWGCRGHRFKQNGERVRIGGAVCWHGHRAFMRALLTAAPLATITTGLHGALRYTGLNHFESTHDATGDINIGSQASPLAFREACDCGDARLLRHDKGKL